MATLPRNVRPVSRYDPSDTTREPPKISGSVVEIEEAPIINIPSRQPPARRPKQSPRRSSRPSKPTDLFLKHNVDQEAREKTNNMTQQKSKVTRKKKETKEQPPSSPSRRSSRQTMPTDFFVGQAMKQQAVKKNQKKRARPRKVSQVEKPAESMGGQRKRGRPRKTPHIEKPAQIGDGPKRRGRPRKYPLAEKPAAEASLGVLSLIALNSDGPKKAKKRGRPKKNAPIKQHRADRSLLSSLMTLNSEEARKESGQPIDDSKKAAKARPKSPPVKRRKKRSMIPVNEESLLSKAVELTSSPAVHTTSILQRLNVFSPNASSSTAVQQSSARKQLNFSASPGAPESSVAAVSGEIRRNQTSDSQAVEPLPKKKRGRPKGSKNKVKKLSGDSNTRETGIISNSQPAKKRGRPPKKPAGDTLVSSSVIDVGPKDSSSSLEPSMNHQLGDKDATSATAQSARKRGRPKGSKSKVAPAEGGQAVTYPTKRGRGRPPRNKPNEGPSFAIKDTPISKPRPVKRRGRPPKSTVKPMETSPSAVKDTAVSESQPNKRRGRPAKSLSKDTAVSEPQPAKTRGRPPKSTLKLTKGSSSVAEDTAVSNPKVPEVSRRRGRPPKKVAGVVVSGLQGPTTAREPQAKKRGRPAGSKNKAPLVEAGQSAATDAMSVQSPPAKRRGRPKGSPAKRRTPHRNSPGAEDAISVLVQLHVAAEKNGRQEEPRIAAAVNQPATRSADTVKTGMTGRPKRKAANDATTALALIAAEDDDIDDALLQVLETESADPQPAKRKRGRPSKVSSTKAQLIDASETSISQQQPIKRKRGRPPKNSSSKVQLAPSPVPEAETVTEKVPSKIKRGRPPKSSVAPTATVPPSTVASAEEQPAGRKRERPSRASMELTIRRNNVDSVSSPPAKRKRGRPPRASKNHPERPDDSKDTMETLAMTESAGLSPRRRKREVPSQDAITSTFTMINWADIASIASPPKKQKTAGRPPKNKSETSKQLDQLAMIGDIGGLSAKRKRELPAKKRSETRPTIRRNHVDSMSLSPLKKRKRELSHKDKPELDHAIARPLNPLSPDPLTTLSSQRRLSKKTKEKRLTIRRDYVDSMASPPKTQEGENLSKNKPELNDETNRPLKKSLKTKSMTRRVRPSTARSESNLELLEQSSASANASRPLRSKRKAARSALAGMAKIPAKYETAGLVEEDEYDPSTDRSSRRTTKNKNRKNYIDCGDCLACCLTKNCGRCIPCLDMPEFGGEGMLNKQCVLRSCLKPIIREASPLKGNKTEEGATTSSALAANDDDVQSLSDNASMIVDDMSDLEWDDDDAPSASAKSARASLHREAAPKAASTTETAADLVRKLREQDRSRQLEYDEESDSEDEDLIPPPPPIDF